LVNPCAFKIGGIASVYRDPCALIDRVDSADLEVILLFFFRVVD
jgi:hypothetical protein